MRQIGTLPKALDPKVFCDHLLALGMRARFDDRPDGWLLWIYSEDHVDRAKAEMDVYLANPQDPRFAQAAPVAAAVRKKEAKLDREYRKNFRMVSDQWTGLQLRRRPVTMGLVITAIVVYFLQHSPSGATVRNALSISPQYFSPDSGWYDEGLAKLLSGQLWRLVTPIFLHFGIMHILFNSWAITLEGTMIETRRGSFRLGVLVLVSAILSNLGQYAFMDKYDPSGLHGFGGLSGVAYALFGYLWMKGQYEPEQGMILHPNSVMMMLLWLVLCMTGAMGPIANAAHVVGLVVGMVFGLARY